MLEPDSVKDAVALVLAALAFGRLPGGAHGQFFRS